MLGYAPPGQVETLIVEVLLIELGKMRQQVFGTAKIVVDVAIDNCNALFGLDCPARRRDGCRAYFPTYLVHFDLPCIRLGRVQLTSKPKYGYSRALVKAERRRAIFVDVPQ